MESEPVGQTMKTLSRLLFLGLIAAAPCRGEGKSFPLLVRAAEGRALISWEGQQKTFKAGDKLGSWFVRSISDGMAVLEERAPKGPQPEKLLLKEGAPALRFLAQPPAPEASTHVDVLSQPKEGKTASFTGEPPKGKE
jgi:hypothetical protein